MLAMRFHVFIVLFFAAYGVASAVLYRGICSAFRPGRLFRALFVLFLLLQAFLPFAARWFDAMGHIAWARAAAVIGYPWMAVLFWFGSLEVIRWLWNLGVRGVSALAPKARRWALPRRASTIAFLILIAAGFAWGLIEVRQFRVREIAIQSPLLYPTDRPLRVLHVSDLHLGLLTSERWLARVVQAIRQINPDVLVCTGDLVDAPLKTIGWTIPALAEIRPPLGKYAVLGNHEYYTGLRHSLPFLQAAGFRVLREEAVDLGSNIFIAGVDDLAGRSMGQSCLTDEAKALDSARRDACVILLKHRPSLTAASRERYDLQLSGHVHGGQIVPGHLFIPLFADAGPGIHRVGNRSLIHVSRGLGTWGPPLRVLAPAEMTLITVGPAGRK